MNGRQLLLAVWCGLLLQPALAAAPVSDGSVLPFPPTPSASVAGPTLQESKHQRRVEKSHLPKDAPNILIILLDDVGFGLPDTYGGPIRTPTLSRIAGQGISYNAFHTTSICSPTRAALLTGRNHQRVGSGTIAERAVDWDGYTGVIPRTSATLPKVLGNYGYKTAAFGKWHNTPATETTAMGPFTNWPTGEGIGFDYFYGFLAGETSQWEPRLVENLNAIEPPHDEKYHLSEDLADKAIAWLRKHRAYAPDKPFFMYWASGASHGPHHIFKEWADKYKGKFDDGWDALRERTFKRQKELGWIPANAKLTPRAATMASWDSIPASERAFQLRLMEIFAGFTEHVDVQVGKIDRRAGAPRRPRQHDRDLHLRRQRLERRRPARHGQRAARAEQHPEHHGAAARRAQGARRPRRARRPEDRQHVPRRLGLGRRHAVPPHQARRLAFRWHAQSDGDLVAGAHQGRQDAALAVPPRQRHRADALRDPRHQAAEGRRRFHAGPDRRRQHGLHVRGPQGAGPQAHAVLRQQWQPRHLSRRLVRLHVRSVRSVGCGRVQRTTIKDWDANKDVWELYDLRSDFSQADDLAQKDPKRLAQMKALFLKEAKANKAFPIGAGNWLRLHPEDRVKTPYTSWQFDATTTRMPEFTAPGLGRESNHVVIDAELGENATGVLYALGGASGGLTLYMDKGDLVYEYNMMVIERYTARSKEKIAAGKRRIEVDTTIAKPGAPAEVVLTVDGKEVARTTVKRTVPAAFTASESFDVGIDLGSPVSLDYFDRRPFKFDGKITAVNVQLK